jgi:hypothetical protein
MVLPLSVVLPWSSALNALRAYPSERKKLRPTRQLGARKTELVHISRARIRKNLHG